MSVALLIAYPVALVFLTLIVAEEDALSHVRGDRLERLVQRRQPGARRLATLQESHESLAMAALMMRSSATVLFAVISYGLIAIIMPSGLFAAPAALAATIAGVILAQAAGHVWGRHDAERLALVTAPIAALVNAVLSVPAGALHSLFSPLARRLGRRESGTSSSERAEARDANGNGALNGDSSARTNEEWERNVMRGLIRLESLAVREIMVPRPDIVGISAGASLEEAVEKVLAEGYSRMPLYRGSLDDTIGILYAKDMLASFQQGENLDLKAIVRPPLMIPETKRVGDLLREFQARRVHIALVVDEYGSLVGLVTNEDLLEEIVGDIDDEFTVSEPLVERLSENEAIVDARAPLKYINELFNIELHAEGVDTVGGLILYYLGHIPHPGEAVNEDGISMTILSTTGRRVRQVRILHGATAEQAKKQRETSTLPTA